jgi:hypothetical protein
VTIRVIGDELIVSGPVTGNELQQVQDALATSPFVWTVILRNSSEEDAPSDTRRAC